MKWKNFNFGLVMVFLLGIIFWALVFIWIFEPKAEEPCEHRWTPGVPFEEAEAARTEEPYHLFYYYTCVLCGKYTGTTYELDTSVADDMFTKAAETLELDTTAALATEPILRWAPEPNMIWDYATATDDPNRWFIITDQEPQVQYYFDANSDPAMMGRFFSHYMKNPGPYGGDIIFHIPEKDKAEYDKIYHGAQDD